jgi:hypothetical protein
MIDGPTLNKIGILLQTGAAAYIVYQDWRTARVLAGYEKVTIDSLEIIIQKLGREMAGQFKHQFIGFAVLAIGAALQLYG